MGQKKIYFDEPVVRVDISKARFPRVCPVCGNRATMVSRLTISSRRFQQSRREWSPSTTLQMRKRQDILQQNLKVLPIQVCSDHYYSDEGEDRYKSLCIIADGLAMAFMFFGLLFLGDSLSRGRSVSLWVPIFTAIFVISLVMTMIAFRPSALAQAVKIVGLDAGMQNVLLAFKNETYRDAFLKENPLNSEPVRWIVKS